MRLSGNLRSAAIRSQQHFIELAVSADGFEDAEVRHDEADFIKIVRIRAQRKLYAVFQTERKKFRIRTVSRMTVDLRRHAVLNWKNCLGELNTMSMIIQMSSSTHLS